MCLFFKLHHTTSQVPKRQVKFVKHKDFLRKPRAVFCQPWNGSTTWRNNPSIYKSCHWKKEVECVWVDWSYDEGPSHVEVQYWWTVRHIRSKSQVLLGTSRNSGASAHFLFKNIIHTEIISWFPFQQECVYQLNKNQQNIEQWFYMHFQTLHGETTYMFKLFSHYLAIYRNVHPCFIWVGAWIFSRGAKRSQERSHSTLACGKTKISVHKVPLPHFGLSCSGFLTLYDHFFGGCPIVMYMLSVSDIVRMVHMYNKYLYLTPRKHCYFILKVSLQMKILL